MSEFLIQAKAHWMDSMSPSDVNKLTPSAKASYDARSQKGDIVVVKPDGWIWGAEERPPNYIVVKVPSLTLSEALAKCGGWTQLTGQIRTLVRKYRFAIPVNYVDTVLSAGGTVTIDRTVVLAQISDKAT